MKRSASFILPAIQILCAFYFHAHACTGVKVKTSQGVLVGCNEDYNTTFKDVIVRVHSAEGDNYGYIGTGFQRHSFFMMGLNDQGLFYDMFTVPSYYQWVPDSNKLNYNGSLEEKMLKECANVGEAIEFLNRYNNPSMGNYPYQIFVADSAGHSAVISWCDGVDVVRSDDTYQVVTNFFLNHTECGWYPCWRYATASDMLEDADTFSFMLVRDILEEVNLSSNYSQICNLNNGNLAIFNDHNFDEFIRLNIYEELAKGRNDNLISDYCAQIKLLSPEDGEEVPSSSKVTIEWEGVSNAHYQLFISDNPDFTNCDPIEVTNFLFLASFGFGLNFLFLGMALSALLSITIRWKWHCKLFLLILVIFCFFPFQCDLPLQNDENDSHLKIYRKTVSNLQQGVTYYWKIVAKTGDGIQCESKVNTFTLSE